MIGRPILLAASLLAAEAAQAAAVPPAPSCRVHPERVGPCRIVRGRLSVANGNPTLRIWVVGTTRMLGIRERGQGGGELPANVWRAMGDNPPAIDLFGDYEVCPLTRQRPGWMQIVCVQSGRRLFARRQRS